MTNPKFHNSKSAKDQIHSPFYLLSSLQFSKFFICHLSESLVHPIGEAGLYALWIHPSNYFFDFFHFVWDHRMDTGNHRWWKKRRSMERLYKKSGDRAQRAHRATRATRNAHHHRAQGVWPQAIARSGLRIGQRPIAGRPATITVWSHRPHKPASRPVLREQP